MDTAFDVWFCLDLLLGVFVIRSFFGSALRQNFICGTQSYVGFNVYFVFTLRYGHLRFPSIHFWTHLSTNKYTRIFIGIPFFRRRKACRNWTYFHPSRKMDLKLYAVSCQCSRMGVSVCARVRFDGGSAKYYNSKSLHDNGVRVYHFVFNVLW